MLPIAYFTLSQLGSDGRKHDIGVFMVTKQNQVPSSVDAETEYRISLKCSFMFLS